MVGEWKNCVSAKDLTLYRNSPFAAYCHARGRRSDPRSRAMYLLETEGRKFEEMILCTLPPAEVFDVERELVSDATNEERWIATSDAISKGQYR